MIIITMVQINRSMVGKYFDRTMLYA